MKHLLKVNSIEIVVINHLFQETNILIVQLQEEVSLKNDLIKQLPYDHIILLLKYNIIKI